MKLMQYLRAAVLQNHVGALTIQISIATWYFTKHLGSGGHCLPKVNDHTITEDSMSHKETTFLVWKGQIKMSFVTRVCVQYVLI